jgi:hypothetical protein
MVSIYQLYNRPSPSRLLEREAENLRTIIVIADIHQGLYSSAQHLATLDHPHLTFWHWSGVTPYTSSCEFAGSCVFDKQSPGILSLRPQGHQRRDNRKSLPPKRRIECAITSLSYSYRITKSFSLSCGKVCRSDPPAESSGAPARHGFVPPGSRKLRAFPATWEIHRSRPSILRLFRFSISQRATYFLLSRDSHEKNLLSPLMTPRQALFRSYGCFFAEFLGVLSLVRLGLLDLTTCVGLRYGSRMVMLRDFSWKRALPDLPCRSRAFSPRLDSSLKTGSRISLRATLTQQT